MTLSHIQKVLRKKKYKETVEYDMLDKQSITHIITHCIPPVTIYDVLVAIGYDQHVASIIYDYVEDLLKTLVKELGKKIVPIDDENALKAIINKNLVSLCPFIKDDTTFARKMNICAKYAITKRKCNFVKYFLEKYVEAVAKTTFMSSLGNFVQWAFMRKNLDMIEFVCMTIESLVPPDFRVWWAQVSLMYRHAMWGDRELCRALLDENKSVEICKACEMCFSCKEYYQCDNMCEVGRCDKMCWNGIDGGYLVVRVGIEVAISRKDLRLINMFAPYCHCFGMYNMDIFVTRVFHAGFELSKAFIDGMMTGQEWRLFNWGDYICVTYRQFRKDVYAYILSTIWLDGVVGVVGVSKSAENNDDKYLGKLFEMCGHNNDVPIVDMIVRRLGTSRIDEEHWRMLTISAAKSGQVDILRWVKQEYGVGLDCLVWGIF